MSPKAPRRPPNDLLAEYDFSRAVRGKYYERYRQGVKITVNDFDTTRRTLIFRDAGAVDAANLGDVLFLLRGAYTAGLYALRRSSTQNVPDSAADVASVLRKHIGKLDVKGIDSLFSKDLGDEALITRSVSYHSPLEMTLSGVPQALAAAILLAGGDFQSALESIDDVPMPSVGEVIHSLRSALAPGVRAPLGFGIRSRRLKLSREELDELLRHDPSSQDRGGFQRFLIGLQSRVNRVTGEMNLSEPEMALILRHGRNPRRGGWQTSIRRIFGRHFDFTTA
jgi:hypothetical protein